MEHPGVGLIGVGRWGRHHLRVLQGLHCPLRVFDRDLRTLAALVPESCQAASFEEILRDPKIRAVVLATPARSHFRLGRQALQAGKDLLVEKPLTLVGEQGEELVALARRQGLVLMVGHVTLYHPALVRLRELVRSGALGSLLYLYSNRLNLGTVREEEDILWSFAPHDVAGILHLTGSWPQEVLAVGGSYLRAGRADVTVTHLVFPGGLRAHIFVSWLHPVKEQRLVAIGASGMAVFTDGPTGGELLHFEHSLGQLQRGDSLAGARDGVALSFEAAEPLRQELAHFLECVVTRREPLSGGQHGLSVLRILEAAQASLRMGGVAVRPEPLGEPAS